MSQALASPPEVSRVLDAFAEEGRGTRWHTRLRARSCPLGEVAALVTGREVLDVGCGHGLLALLLALGDAERRVHGVDLDPGKVAAARRAATRLAVDDRVTFEVVGEDWRPPAEHVDAVVCVDVLYLLEPDRVGPLLDGLAAACRPGGSVVVKELADGPRWQLALSRLQELLATRVLRITAGRAGRPVSLDLVDHHLRGAGFRTMRVRLGGHLHPHEAVVGTDPSHG